MPPTPHTEMFQRKHDGRGSTASLGGAVRAPCPAPDGCKEDALGSLHVLLRGPSREPKRLLFWEISFQGPPSLSVDMGRAGSVKGSEDG